MLTMSLPKGNLQLWTQLLQVVQEYRIFPSDSDHSISSLVQARISQSRPPGEQLLKRNLLKMGQLNSE
jgi:hypothetical protein